METTPPFDFERETKRTFGHRELGNDPITGTLCSPASAFRVESGGTEDSLCADDSVQGG